MGAIDSLSELECAQDKEEHTLRLCRCKAQARRFFRAGASRYERGWSKPRSTVSRPGGQPRLLRLRSQCDALQYLCHGAGSPRVAVASVWCSCIGSLHCMHERSKPAPFTRRRPSQGIRHADGSWRGKEEGCAPIAYGKLHAVLDFRRVWNRPSRSR